MEVPSKTSNKKRKREPSVDARITYHAPSKTFERLFQEHSLEDIKRVVRRKLGLAEDLDVQLSQIRGNSSIVLEDDDDFEAFRVALEANSLVDMRVSVVPRENVPQPIPLAPKPNISSILPELLPPTKRSKTKTDQHPKRSKPKPKPKKTLHHILSPSPAEPIDPPSKDRVSLVSSPRPTTSEALQKKKQVAGKKRQPRPEPEPQKDDELATSPQVKQIINSVRTARRTPQEILAAFGNTNTNQTTYRPLREPPPPVPKPIVLPLNGLELAQQVQELRNKGETDLVRLIEDHQSNGCNPGKFPAETEKHGLSNLSVSPELQSSGLPSPPSIDGLYRSEITVQSPGEGSSSPPSPAHGQPGDRYDETDPAELLLELSAKNIAASLVSRSPTPVPARPPAEIDEMSNEGAKVGGENSENDERQVVLQVRSRRRRKSSESPCSKSSSDTPSANDMPSPASQKITLTAPPVVQSASLIRTQSKITSPPLSPTLLAVNLPPEIPESPVIEKFKSPTPHDTSIEAGKVRQLYDEELEPTRFFHQAVNTTTPSSLLPRQRRQSQSLPRLSILPRTVTQLLLPKSTSGSVPATLNPGRDEEKDTTSSDDDSSDSDNQTGKQIPANQQAGSRPGPHRHRNVLASFD